MPLKVGEAPPLSSDEISIYLIGSLVNQTLSSGWRLSIREYKRLKGLL